MIAAAWREFQTRWQAHLERYGAMIYTLDFGQPLPMDEPVPLLETLKLYASDAFQAPTTASRGWPSSVRPRCNPS